MSARYRASFVASDGADDSGPKDSGAEDSGAEDSAAGLSRAPPRRADPRRTSPGRAEPEVSRVADVESDVGASIGSVRASGEPSR